METSLALLIVLKVTNFWLFSRVFDLYSPLKRTLCGNFFHVLNNWGLFLVSSQWQQKSRLRVSTLCAKLGFLAVSLSVTVIKQRVVIPSHLTLSENQNKLISQNVTVFLFCFL